MEARVRCGFRIITTSCSGLANAHCNTIAEYEDKVFEICGKSRKIRRTWTIYDWCGHRDTTCEQWIIVKDTIAPFLNFFDYFDLGRSEMDTTSLLDLADKFTVLAYTEPHDCKAHVHLPDVKNTSLTATTLKWVMR